MLRRTALHNHRAVDRNTFMLGVEEVDRLVKSSRAPRRWLTGPRMVLLGLGVLLGAYLARPDLFTGSSVPAWLLPQIVVLSLGALMLWTVIQQRRRGRLMLEAFEAVQLREWPRAETALRQLLSRPIKIGQTRVEALLGLAAVAESEQQYDAAQHIYESVLQSNEADPIQKITTRIALAAAMLRTGQTADAVELAEKLGRDELPGPLQAQVEMLTLFRAVTMGQVQDAVADAERRRELFRRHLSTRAGFGYALLAWAFDRDHQSDTARDYWRKATLLIRPKEIIERFDELSVLAERYPAAEFVV